MTDQETEAVLPQVVLEHSGHRRDYHGDLLCRVQHISHSRGQHHP